MNMLSICRCSVYAYVLSMQMYGIWICHTYSCFLYFLRKIRKKVVQDLPLLHTTPPPVSTTCSAVLAADDTICCVISLICDAPRRGGKQRYDYFLSVVHFRKVVYSKKVGSIRNGNAVITLCFYKSDFNFYWLT
jgi:hypothetical protein